MSPIFSSRFFEDSWLILNPAIFIRESNLASSYLGNRGGGGSTDPILSFLAPILLPAKLSTAYSNASALSTPVFVSSNTSNSTGSKTASNIWRYYD